MYCFVQYGFSNILPTTFTYKYMLLLSDKAAFTKGLYVVTNGFILALHCKY